MDIDFAPALQGVAMLAASVITAATPIGVAMLRGWLATKISAQQADAIAGAASRGAGLAYEHLVRAGGGVHHAEIANVALAKGANYVLAAFPDAIARLGVTPERVHAMVTAELGKLLAIDPTATVTAPADPVAVPAT